MISRANMPATSLRRWFVTVVAMVTLALVAMPVSSVYAEQLESKPEGSGVMKGFVEQHETQNEANEVSNKQRHQILFAMGAALLILILITGSLGIAMAVSGKPLYLPHMIFAGLSITLALAHSIAAVVWFFPF